MGICFVGKRKSGFQAFLKEYSNVNPGPIVNIEDCKQVGQHQGLQFWTIGQRLGMSGASKAPIKKRCYVVDKDMATNTIYICFSKEAHHPALYRKASHSVMDVACQN